MTLSKLAQLANVSVSVVSKAFSGKDGISDTMREHVFAVAREHGCFQQFYHVPYDKPVIAVIVPEVISLYYVHYIEALGRRIEENGYTMLLSISNFDRQLASELVRYYTIHSKVDGILLLSAVNELPENISTAIVSIGACAPSNTASEVSFDLSVGVQAALTHLKEKGHVRIAYIGEPFTSNQRELLIKEIEAADLEISPSCIITSRARFEAAGEEGVRRIWESGERPTAIFGAYGYITRGILQKLRSMELLIPRDVAVLSLDNDPAPLDAVLDVSCVPSEIEARCDAALQLLQDRMHKKHPHSPSRIVLPSHFHIGDTT